MIKLPDMDQFSDTKPETAGVLRCGLRLATCERTTYITTIVMILARVLAPISLGAAELEVEEIGSFHIGGRSVALSGLPPRQLAFTVGAPSLLVDPNGDIEVEQMYVHYVLRSRALPPSLSWSTGPLSYPGNELVEVS